MQYRFITEEVSFTIQQLSCVSYMEWWLRITISVQICFCIDDPTLTQIILFSGTITSVTAWRARWTGVKNMIFQHVKSKTCVINGAKIFAEYANKIINGISCLYLADNEIMAEPQDIETSPKIPRTLKELTMKIMFVKWSFTSLLTYSCKTCFTFSGTAKRATRKLWEWSNMRLLQRKIQKKLIVAQV